METCWVRETNGRSTMMSSSWPSMRWRNWCGRSCDAVAFSCPPMCLGWEARAVFGNVAGPVPRPSADPRGSQHPTPGESAQGPEYQKAEASDHPLRA